MAERDDKGNEENHQQKEHRMVLSKFCKWELPTKCHFIFFSRTESELTREGAFFCERDARREDEHRSFEER